MHHYECVAPNVWHHSPEWTILSHVNSFIQGEVQWFQVLLGSLHPRSTGASQWSPISSPSGKPFLGGWAIFAILQVGIAVYFGRCRNLFRAKMAQPRILSSETPMPNDTNLRKSRSCWYRKFDLLNHQHFVIFYFTCLPRGVSMELPADIHACSSSHTFRRLLKTHCFNQASSSPLAAHTSASDSAFGRHCAL